MVIPWKSMALLSCFCQERKHKEILTAAKDVNNLSRYEASVYKEICAKQLHALQSPLPHSIALTSNCKPTAAILTFLRSCGLIPPGAKCFVCRPFRFSGRSVYKNDLVLLQASADEGLWGCAKILLIFAIDEVQCMVSPCQLLEYRKKHAAAIWQPLDQQRIVHASQVLATLTYSKTKTGFITFLTICRGSQKMLPCSRQSKGTALVANVFWFQLLKPTRSCVM